MKHNHHHCECEHAKVEFCGTCKVVHCLDCKMEWSHEPCQRAHTYPYYPWTWSTGVGISSPTYTVTAGGGPAQPATGWNVANHGSSGAAVDVIPFNAPCDHGQ